MSRWIGMGNKYGSGLILWFLMVFASGIANADLILGSQNHVYGGKPQTHHSGATDIPRAWSGSIHAVVYYDYLPEEKSEGMFLLLSRKNGNIINKPIRLTSGGWQCVDIVWDGDAFDVFLLEGANLFVKRYSLTGNLFSEKRILLSLQNNNNFTVIFKNNVFNFFQYKDDSVTWSQIDQEGKVLDGSISLPSPGQNDKVFLGDSYVAVVASQPMESSIANANVSIFDYNGTLLGGPTKISNVSYTPFRSIAGNTENILLFTGMTRSDSGVDMKIFCFDLKGKQVGEPAVVGTIPADGYYGKVNFTTELVSNGQNYLAVWDNSIDKSGFMEYIYARLVDANGIPIGEIVQINQESLDQVNHAGTYTGDGFSIFSIEQGYLQPSVDFTRFILKDIQSTPTPNNPTETPTALPTPDYTGSKLTLRAAIDGLDEVHVKGKNLWYKHLDYTIPNSTTVNGTAWTPKWTGEWPNSQTSDNFEISPALPSSGMVNCQLLSYKARGKIVITQQPKTDNGYELIVLLDDSNEGAADFYEFELVWSSAPLDGYKPPVTPYYYWKGMQRDTRETVFILKENKCTIKNEVDIASWKTITYDSVFSEPLPLASVDLTAVMVEGNGRALVTQQPRPENDYTAVVIMMANNFEINKDYSFYVTWGKPLSPQPTATPVPTFNPAQPSPAPESKSKILCFTKPNDGSEYSAFKNSIESLGLELVTLPYGEIEITPALLQGFAAVVVGLYDTYVITPMPLTASEQAAIRQYVRGGGGLLINGLTPSDNYNNLPMQYCNSFGNLFGIAFTEKITGTVGQFLTHPITTDLRFSYCDEGSILDVTEPAKAIGFFKGNKAALAVAEEGYGRIVALSGFRMYTTAYSSGRGTNNPVLINNILAWLLHKEDTAIVKPDPFPKNSIVLTLTNEGNFFPQDIVYTIQGNAITHSVVKTYKPTLETVINQPLPSVPVIIQVTTLDPVAKVTKIIQPSLENNYKASFSIKVNYFPWNDFNGPIVVVVTWGEPLTATPPPTITPLPTFNPLDPSPTPSGDAANVLWIQRPEAYTTTFQQIFTGLGATNHTIEIKDAVLSDDLLKKYNVVIFGDSGNDYANSDLLTPEEQGSLARFVKSGGSIFVMGYQQNTLMPDLSADYATSITKPFGITFGLHTSGISTDFASHPLLNNVSIIGLENGSILEISSPAEPIAFDKDHEPIFAVSHYGYGRIAAFASSRAFSMHPYLPDMGITDSNYSHKQLANNIAMWLLRKDSLIPAPAPSFTPTPTFALADTEDQRFLNQVIKVNRPWLEPKPVKAEYEIFRNGEFFRAYDITEKSPSYERLGTYVETPLHSAAWNSSPYEVKIMGTTEYKGHPATIFNLIFTGYVSDVYSLGTKGLSISEHHQIRSGKIYVDTETKTVLKLMSYSSNNPETDSPVHTWEFNPEYFEIDDGYAPKDLTAYGSVFNEYQEFQIVDGYWFNKTGNAWYSDDTTVGTPGEKIQTVDIRNLIINPGTNKPTPTMNRQTPTPTVTPASSSPSGTMKKGQFTFKADFSGELLVHIQGKDLWLEQSGTSAQPRICWINNDIWHPEWNEGKSSLYEKLNPSLPDSDGYRYLLSSMSSYTTTLVQTPNTENNFEAVILVKTKNGNNGSLSFSWKNK